MGEINIAVNGRTLMILLWPISWILCVYRLAKQTDFAKLCKECADGICFVLALLGIIAFVIMICAFGAGYPALGIVAAVSTWLTVACFVAEAKYM